MRIFKKRTPALSRFAVGDDGIVQLNDDIQILDLNHLVGAESAQDD